jgi:hypothetical protein
MATMKTAIAAMRRDTVLDLIGRVCPLGDIPSVNDVSEYLDSALSLLGMPWVWALAGDMPRNEFARRLSAVGPINLVVADTVQCYCRMHS